MEQRLIVKKKIMLLFLKFYGVIDVEKPQTEMNVMDMVTEKQTGNVSAMMDGVVMLVKPEYVTAKTYQKVAKLQKMNTMNMVA